MNSTIRTVAQFVFYISVSLGGGAASYLFALQVAGNSNMGMWFCIASYAMGCLFVGAGIAAFFAISELFREPRR